MIELLSGSKYVMSVSIYSFKKFFNWVLHDDSLSLYPLKCKCDYLLCKMHSYVLKEKYLGACEIHGWKDGKLFCAAREFWCFQGQRRRIVV